MKVTEIIQQLKKQNLNLITHLLTDDVTIKSKVICYCNICENKEVTVRLEDLRYCTNKIFCKICELKVKNNQRFLAFQKKAVIKHNKKYTYIENTFDKGYIEIICKLHGVFKQKTKDHLYKHGCPTCGVETTQFKKGSTLTLQEVKERLKYNDNNVIVDYTTYTGWENLTLKCVCKTHGEFIIKPKNFQKRLNKCKECAIFLNSHSRSNFIKIAQKHNGMAIIYAIRCFNKTEEFYKIGITTQTVLIRFGKKKFPYNIEVIQEIIGMPCDIWDLEKLVLKNLKPYQYTPIKSFSGESECFKFVKSLNEV